MITVLSGGTGTPKLLMGLQRVLARDSICVVANTAEDTLVSGSRMSPDLDSVIYALAGVIDQQKWYGMADDTFHTYDAMLAFGYNELLRMGDKDRATKLYRTVRLSEGATLSQVTREQCERWNIEERVFPMSDDPVQTIVSTDEGPLTFHEFWVRDRGRHIVDAVAFNGSDTATITGELRACIEASDVVLIGPSNPVTSILPILSVSEIYELCKEKRTVAVSPLVGSGAFSGPATTLMHGLGYTLSAVGVAEIYHSILDDIIIDTSDAALVPELEEMGLGVHATDIFMKDLYTSRALGEDIKRYLVID
ncbi:2-phospho-L-lactate transferase [archaeon]|nr:MAG: 2-phospho-L-lactate transferase [archaeon]